MISSDFTSALPLRHLHFLPPRIPRFFPSYLPKPALFRLFYKILEKSSPKILPCCRKFLPLHSLSGRSAQVSSSIGE